MRRALAAAAFASIALPLLAACVDLFHGTDFSTFCTTHPGDPQCGGEAGADASAHPAPLPLCAGSSDEARARAAHACAWLGACEGASGTSRYGACFGQAELAYDCDANPSMRPLGDAAALWMCLASAATCSDVDACVFPDGVPPCQAVTSGSFTACGINGNAAVRVTCDVTSTTTGRPTAAEPCALTGRACTARSKSTAQCTGVGGTDCGSFCNGTGAVTCGTGTDSTVDLGVDCASFGGGGCTGGTTPACVPSGSAACPGDVVLQPSCSEGDVVSCVAGKLLAISCSRLGLDCDDGGTTVFPQLACTPPGDAGACAEACSGATLTSCLWGTRGAVTVDCASVGLGACVVNEATAAAQCKPPSP